MLSPHILEERFGSSTTGTQPCRFRTVKHAGTKYVTSLLL